MAFVLLAASDPQEQNHKCGPPWAMRGLGKRTVSAQKEAKQLLLKAAGSLTEAMEKLGTTIIPAFQVEEQAEADALITWLDDNNPNEAFVPVSYTHLHNRVAGAPWLFPLFAQ